MNKIIKIAAVLAAGTVLTTGSAFARPHHGGFHRSPPVHHGWHHAPHHHGAYWGRGGHCFWPGFVGGVIGGAIGTTLVRPYSTETVVVQPTTTVVTTPTVVQQPVIVQQPVQQVQNVWVEGRYVDQVQANGSVVRVWQPGHYEQQTVIAP